MDKWFRCGFLAMLALLLSACMSTADEPSPSIKKPTKTVDKRPYNPTAAGYNVQLGVAYLRQGDIERAKHKLMLAEKQDPKSALVLDAKAYFFESTGDPDEAEKLYRRAIKLNPKMGLAENNYGAFLCRQGRFQAADQEFMLAVQDPAYLSMGEAYENAGLCAMQNKQLAQAEKYFKQAIKKQPKLTNSLLLLARLNYDQGNFSQAQFYLSRFNQFGKSEPESLKLAVQLADKQKDKAKLQANLIALGKAYPDSYEYEAMRVAYGR